MADHATPTVDFDELAAACADAFRAGDDATGDARFLELYATVLAPDMRRRLRFFAWNPQVREEVWTRVLEQVYVRMLRAGKPVQRRWLGTIYRRCTFDELAAINRHASRAASIGPDDDLETLLGRAGVASDEAAGTIVRLDVERLIRHVERTCARPQWGTVLRAMADGHARGSDIPAATGMTQVRVRQVKMELGRYLAGDGAGLLERGAA